MSLQLIYHEGRLPQLHVLLSVTLVLPACISSVVFIDWSTNSVQTCQPLLDEFTLMFLSGYLLS